MAELSGFRKSSIAMSIAANQELNGVVPNEKSHLPN